MEKIYLIDFLGFHSDDTPELAGKGRTLQSRSPPLQDVQI